MLLAARSGARVDVHIGAHVRTGRRIRIVIEPGSTSSLHVGDYCELDDDVRIQLKGGAITLAEGVQLRRGVTLNVSGDLSIAERVVVSWGTVVHCAQHVHIGARSAIGEFVTIVDSTHFHTTSDTMFTDNVAVGTVDVGENTWIAAKATISRNVSIGSHCIVGASAVVLADVPDNHLASGIPARHKRLDHPWIATPAQAPDHEPSSPS